MLSLEPEIVALRDGGSIPAEVADRLIRIERREVFSVDAELRAILYIAVALLTTGAGILLAGYIHEIRPLLIVVLIGASSAAVRPEAVT